MKKTLFLSLGLMFAITAATQPRWYFARENNNLRPPDTVQTAAFPGITPGGKMQLWDFSRLNIDNKFIISEKQNNNEYTDIREDQTVFHYIARKEGNYYTGFDNARKSIKLHEAYNKLPYPLTFGLHLQIPYTASGLYAHSGVTSLIKGSHTLDVDGEGTVILPDGRQLCNATRLKTVDTYTETSYNTTTVNIEKYLWYVPYYSFPVFVTVETAYTYSEGGSDTLRAAYYTTNAMPAPFVSSINDTTICLGQSVRLSASGEGLLLWKKTGAATSFASFKDTLLHPTSSVSYVLMAAGEQCDTPTVYDTVNITVETRPSLQLENRNLTVCRNAPFSLQAVSASALQWYTLDGDGILTALDSNTVSLTADSRFVVKAYNNACTAVFDTLSVKTSGPPTPELTVLQSGGDVIFDVKQPEINKYFYLLDFGDGSPLANKTMQLHQYATAGTYTATLTLTDKLTGCTDNSLHSIIIDPEEELRMILYPNPATYLLNVITPSPILFYRIVDVGTQAIYQATQRPGQETGLQIEVGTLPTGAYMLQLQTLNGWISQVFIKAQ